MNVLDKELFIGTFQKIIYFWQDIPLKFRLKTPFLNIKTVNNF